MTALRRYAQHPLVSGSVALMGARLVSIAAGLVTVSIVVRALDETSFGFWSALVSLTTLTAGLDLGIGNAVRNRIATLRATGDEAGASDVFGAALLVVALLSAALAGLVLAAAGGVRAIGWEAWTGEQERAIVVAVILLGAFQIGNLGQLALYAREQPVLVASLEVARWAITVPALLLIATADGGLVAMTLGYFLPSRSRSSPPSRCCCPTLAGAGACPHRPGRGRSPVGTSGSARGLRCCRSSRPSSTRLTSWSRPR